MWCESGCGSQNSYPEEHNHSFLGFSPAMFVEEEIKTLEGLKETLEDRVNKVTMWLEVVKG